MVNFIMANPLPVAAIIFAAMSIPIVVCDIRTMTVPDILIYAGSAAMLLFRVFFTRGELLLYIIAAVLSFGLFMLARRMAKKGLGWADIKYAAFCGLFAGPLLVFMGYVASALYCMAYFAVLKSRGRCRKETAVPFTPFMFLGTATIAAIPIVKHFTS